MNMNNVNVKTSLVSPEEAGSNPADKGFEAILE